MNELTTVQYDLFRFIMITLSLLYVIALLGLSIQAPQYIATLDYYVKIYISLFLIWRFNIFRHVKFNDLDKTIAFNAGLFLFATTVLSTILSTYFKEIKSYVLSKL